MLEVGSPAPEFAVTAHDGSTVRLSELRGKTVVLWFYPKAGTGGWTTEGRGFRDLYDTFTQYNVHILGASFDTVEVNKIFAENHNFPYRLLCDTDHVIGKAYGAGDSGMPSRITYVIDENGLIAHAFPKVNSRTHAEEVLALVQA